MSDATAEIKAMCESLPDVIVGTSCNQTAYMVGKGKFLFIGPGRKGQGHKAMFKLKASMDQALELAAKQPKRFEVGKTGWVTVRFTNEEPLASEIWEKWLQESYLLTKK